MKRNTLIFICICAVLIGFTFIIQTAGQVDSTVHARWSVQLHSLQPDLPLAYYELAEDVIDEADDETALALGQHLFRLAGALDPMHLGPGSCLALANLSDDPLEKRRMSVLASLLTDSRSDSLMRQPLNSSSLASADLSTALSLAEAFSYFRTGQGSRALSTLQDPQARRLLTSVSHYLPGGAEHFLEECRSHRGRVRPSLLESELIRMLRIEIALLAGEQRTWSDYLLVSKGMPLIDIDLENLGEAFGVNASRPYYRHGQWIAEPME